MATESHGPDEFSELLAAIMSDLNNDKPRLAYAGRIEKIDPERATLIRTQIAVARLPSTDHPDWLRLAAVADRLLAGRREEWIPKWYAEARIREIEFHRGFIESVTVPGGTLIQRKTRAELLMGAPIRHLNIIDIDGDGDFKLILEGFLGDGVAQRIASLNLDAQNLTDMSVFNLQQYNLRGLRWLSLAHNHIGEWGVRALADGGIWSDLRNLEYVNLEGNPIDPVDKFEEDQGVVVGRHRPKIQSSLPPARWMRQNVVAGHVVDSDRFSLALSEHGNVAGAAQ